MNSVSGQALDIWLLVDVMLPTVVLQENLVYKDLGGYTITQTLPIPAKLFHERDLSLFLYMLMFFFLFLPPHSCPLGRWVQGGVCA